MSWHIQITGLRPSVKAAILADTPSNSCIPTGIRQTIADICDDTEQVKGGNLPTNGLRVVGYGHQGGGFGNISRLEVECVEIAMPTTVPAGVETTK